MKLATLAAVAALWACAPANAQQMLCGQAIVVEQGLKTNLGLRPTLRLDGPVVSYSILRNAETGAWVALRVDPQGNACIMASGQEHTEDPTSILVPIGMAL